MFYVRWPGESARAERIVAAFWELPHPPIKLGERALLVLQRARLLHLLHHVSQSQTISWQHAAVPATRKHTLQPNMLYVNTAHSYITTWKHDPSASLVYEDSLHPQGSGNSAGMLATCTPETRQHVLRCIVALSLWGREEERKEKKLNMILNV